MKLTVMLIILLTSFQAFAQDKPAYKIYTQEGRKADFVDLVKSANKSDVVFFGELHDNPIAHWLELELTRSLFSAKGQDLILSAEMFEKDNQILIDEYLSGFIKENSFETEVRLWKNYATDYKPLMNFAKDNGLRFVASNIPRRYASVVASGGFEALRNIPSEELRFLAPLPIAYDPELPCYKDMLSMGGSIGGAMDGKVSENLPKAQAIKDATMAKSIADSWITGRTIIHFNGSYHTDRHEGIIWYLNRYNPSIKSVTISTVLQDDIEKLNDENKGLADFVIVIPTSMTRTYK
jgi:uncharacterized iron-regulated protein